MERRILELEVIERNAGAVRFKIAKQSHFGMGSFCNAGFPNYNRIILRSPSRREKNNIRESWSDYGFCDFDYAIDLATTEEDIKNNIYYSSEAVFDKINKAAEMYTADNGGFGFDDVCPTCGQEVKEWKPKIGDTVYWVDAYGCVKNYVWQSFCEEGINIESGNYFKTHELAKTAAEAVKEVLKNAKHS